MHTSALTLNSIKESHHLFLFPFVEDLQVFLLHDAEQFAKLLLSSLQNTTGKNVSVKKTFQLHNSKSKP